MKTDVKTKRSLISWLCLSFVYLVALMLKSCSFSSISTPRSTCVSYLDWINLNSLVWRWCPLKITRISLCVCNVVSETWSNWFCRPVAWAKFKTIRSCKKRDGMIWYVTIILNLPHLTTCSSFDYVVLVAFLVLAWNVLVLDMSMRILQYLLLFDSYCERVAWCIVFIVVSNFLLSFTRWYALSVRCLHTKKLFAHLGLCGVNDAMRQRANGVW